MTLTAPAPRLAVPEEIAPDALRGFSRAASVVDLEGATMGTQWRVRLALPEGVAQDALFRAIQARLDRIVAQMSHWEATSLLRAFNEAPGGTWTRLPDDFASVVACALRIAEASGGAFNPVMGRLTDIWGLGARKVDGSPTSAEIGDALAFADWRSLAFDEAASRLRQPGGVWLDLSGIAKGYAADAVAASLCDMHVYHALVEVGGEFAGRGIRPDGDPWWVDLEAPQGHILPGLRVALCQLAVATSGDYLRGAHTLDPATGLPAIHETTAVSVIHASCMEADAWATALSVLPPAQAQGLATKMGLCARLLQRDGTEWLSPALVAML